MPKCVPEVNADPATDAEGGSYTSRIVDGGDSAFPPPFLLPRALIVTSLYLYIGEEDRAILRFWKGALLESVVA